MADEILSGLKGIKQELRAVQDQMAGLDAGSQEFVKLSQKAGELRDRMKDVAEAVNANAGPAIGSFGNNLSIARGQLGELDITGFGESMKRMGANVKSVSFKDMGEGLKSVTGGFSTLGKALLTNPIFLIATAILGIVANFDKLTKAGGLVGKVFGFIKEQIDFVINGITAFLNYTGIIDSEAEARAEAAKKRAEDLKKLDEDVTNFLDAQTKKRLASNMSARDKEIWDLKQYYGKLVDEAQKLGRTTNDLEESYKKDLAQINEKYRKIEAEKAKAEAEKKKAENQKALQEAIRLREEDQKNFTDVMQSRDATLVSGTSKQIELQTTLTQVTQTEEEKRLAAEQKANDERKEMWAAAWHAKYELASAATNAMINLNNALTESGLISAEKGFKIGKGLSIAQTTIATIQGVQNALSAVTTIPDPFGTALKIANAVSIGAAGAVNIAKIAKTQFNAPGAGVTPTAPSGGGGGGGAMSAPSAQSPSALNLSFLQGNTSVAPLQTYVLAGQVSNAQQAEFKIKNTASILGGG